MYLQERNHRHRSYTRAIVGADPSAAHIQNGTFPHLTYI